MNDPDGSYPRTTVQLEMIESDPDDHQCLSGGTARGLSIGLRVSLP